MSEALNYADLCDLLEEYRETTDYYDDEEPSPGGIKKCKKNKRQKVNALLGTPSCIE